MTRTAFLISIVTIGLGSAGVADDVNPEAEYRKAVVILEDLKAQIKKASDLAAKAANAKSAAEYDKIRRDYDAAKDSATDAEKKARTILESIAPPDRKGYGPAHISLMELTYRMEYGPDGKLNLPSPLKVKESERHLQFALEWPDEKIQAKAHLELARIDRDTNQMDKAKKHLAIAAEKNPEYRLVLAEWAKWAKEKHDVIAAHAQAALVAFGARLKKDASDHEARFGCVSCLTLLAKFADAERLVTEGAALAATPELIRAYARRMTEVFLASFDAQELDPKSKPEDRFEILARAIKLDPENTEVFNRMLRLTKDNSPTADKVRERLRAMANGQNAWLANLFLGIDAFNQSKTEAAREYWEKALKQSDGAPLVANNLAWALAHSDPLDLPRALELADSAVAKTPGENRYRGTRGHILAKLGRNKEALQELERAIEAYPTDVNLFRVLSDVCTKLGNAKKAEQYKKRADELETKPEGGGAP